MEKIPNTKYFKFDQKSYLTSNLTHNSYFKPYYQSVQKQPSYLAPYLKDHKPLQFQPSNDQEYNEISTALDDNFMQELEKEMEQERIKQQKQMEEDARLEELQQNIQRQMEQERERMDREIQEKRDLEYALKISKPAIARIGKVLPNSPGDMAGFRLNDYVISANEINGETPKSLEKLRSSFGRWKNTTVAFEVKRGTQFVNLRMVPKVWEGQGITGLAFLPPDY